MNMQRMLITVIGIVMAAGSVNALQAITYEITIKGRTDLTKEITVSPAIHAVHSTQQAKNAWADSFFGPCTQGERNIEYQEGGFAVAPRITVECTNEKEYLRIWDMLSFDACHWIQDVVAQKFDGANFTSLSLAQYGTAWGDVVGAELACICIKGEMQTKERAKRVCTKDFVEKARALNTKVQASQKDSDEEKQGKRVWQVFTSQLISCLSEYCERKFLKPLSQDFVSQCSLKKVAKRTQLCTYFYSQTSEGKAALKKWIDSLSAADRKKFDGNLTSLDGATEGSNSIRSELGLPSLSTGMSNKALLKKAGTAVGIIAACGVVAYCLYNYMHGASDKQQDDQAEHEHQLIALHEDSNE